MDETLRGGPDVLVLCYHALSELWPSVLAVRPGVLDDQLASLVRAGYRGATFYEAVTAPREGRTMAVTFDDSFRSVFQLAAPILERHGLPGTVFVPTAFAARRGPMGWPGIDDWLGGPYEGELEPMSWKELRALVGAGWEIGSHTQTHPRLTELGDRELREELAGSRHECERRLGKPCRSLAYPYGASDSRVRSAVSAVGYELGATLMPSLGSGDLLRWPRVGIYRSDRSLRFRLKVSPTVRRLRGHVRRAV